MKGVAFVVNAFEDLVDVVVHCSHSVEPLFCTRRRELVGVIDVYGAWIKAMEASVGGEFVGSSSCGIVCKFCER